MRSRGIDDLEAPKQSMRLSINSDLYGQARHLVIHGPLVAEEALAREVAERTAEQIRAEVRQDLAALDAYEAEHGSFSEMVREHYPSAEDEGS
jgi:post-segregation antitoxin (ccd killing protein)